MFTYFYMFVDTTFIWIKTLEEIFDVSEHTIGFEVEWILTWRSKQDSNFFNLQQNSYRQKTNYDNCEQYPTTISRGPRDSWQETIYTGRMDRKISPYVKTTHNIEIRQIVSGEKVPTGDGTKENPKSVKL